MTLVYGLWLASRTAKKYGRGGYQIGLFTIVNDEGKVVDPGVQLLYIFNTTPSTGSASKQGTDEALDPVGESMSSSSSR